MRAVFCHDTYYTRDKNGVYAHGAFPYSLWQERFLPHFESLTVIGREQISATTSRLELSSGEKVNFLLLENINAPFKRIFKAKKISNAIKNEIKGSNALILRGPVEFAMIAAKYARKHNIPYAVEMSGCAFDHTWYHGSIIGKLYAPLKYLRARHMVKNAQAVIYVTEQFLQQRYPSKGLTSHASNVELEALSPIVLQKRLQKIESAAHTIFGLIGNYTNALKGLDILLKVLERIKETRIDFEFRILGHGNPDTWLPSIRSAGLENHIKFYSPVPGGKEVLEWLDEIDVYLQPSRHEGLPRALIEAMSRGCPALASDAGGTTELLPLEAIHRRGDIKKLEQDMLRSFSAIWQKEQALRNFEVAKKYSRSVLKPKRDEFWNNFAKIAGARKTY